MAEVDELDERRLAVDLFNEVWRLLGTRADDDRMLHAAHASRFHWGEVGEPVNLARGEWQCSRVYAVLGRVEPSLWHARRSLQLCEEHGIGDFDRAYAYEALARAHAVAGDAEETLRFTTLAREAVKEIAAEDDRKHFLADVETIPV